MKHVCYNTITPNKNLNKISQFFFCVVYLYCMHKRMHVSQGSFLESIAWCINSYVNIYS